MSHLPALAGANTGGAAEEVKTRVQGTLLITCMPGNRWDQDDR